MTDGGILPVCHNLGQNIRRSANLTDRDWRLSSWHSQSPSERSVQTGLNADERIRTSTPRGAQAPEACASANSATSAQNGENQNVKIKIQNYRIPASWDDFQNFALCILIFDILCF